MNEISALRAELVFRDIPGKLGQWGRQTQRLRRGSLGGPLIQSPGNGVVRVPAAPTRLGLLPAGSLTFRLAASPLPIADTRVWPKPLTADSAGSFPGLWHRDPSSPRCGCEAN